MSNPKPYKITIIDNIIVLSFSSKLEAENCLQEVIEWLKKNPKPS